MSDSGNAPAFRLTLVGDVPAAIRRLAAESAALGKKQAYLDAFRGIQERLSNNPSQFGECRYGLMKGELQCHIGAIRPVAVRFAIHEERHVVFILNVFLLGS